MSPDVSKLSDLIGMITAFLLTVAILSYIFGDNIVFRIAVSLFIGASAGLVVMGVFLNILLPKLVFPLIGNLGPNKVILLPPLLLGLLIFSFLQPRISALGSLTLALMVGIGAATIIGGAVSGTIMPLVGGSLEAFDRQAAAGSEWYLGTFWINNFLMLIGLVGGLYAFRITNLFHTSDKLKSNVKPIQTVGKCFIAIALGVIYFGVMLASQAAFIERVQFMKSFFIYLITPGG